jgi:YbbR domain-containing protein
VARGADFLHILRESLRGNLGLKVLALCLATALWWFVVGESKVQVGYVIPLEIRNVPPGMTITNKVERQVEVRLSGPPFLLGKLQQSDVTAAVDLSGVKNGRRVVTMDERSVVVPPGIKVQRVYPGEVEVILERLERRQVPVYAKIEGGGIERRRIAKTEVVPSTLEVEALPPDFARIRSLTAPVLLPEEVSGSFAENVRVELREGHARIVGNPIVRVTVHFRK